MELVRFAPQTYDEAAFAPFTEKEAQKAHDFHAGFAQYKETPLASLPGLAQALGVKSVAVKDESYRFGLNAF